MAEIRLEVPEGRAHDDHLGVGERALVDALVELPDDRLRVVIRELIDIGLVHTEAEAALLDGLD